MGNLLRRWLEPETLNRENGLAYLLLALLLGLSSLVMPDGIMHTALVLGLTWGLIAFLVVLGMLLVILYPHGQRR